MTQETGNHELIVRFLLGELSEEERTRTEERYFADDDLFEELQAVEAELIDTFLRGGLSGGQLKQFEAHYRASPARRQRLEVGRALIECATQSFVAVSPVAEGRKPLNWWPFLRDSLGAKNKLILLPSAVSVLAIVTGGALFFVQTARLRNQVEQIQADREETLRRERELRQRLAEQGVHNEQLANDLQQERSQRELLEQELAKRQQSTLSTATLLLTPDLIRGAGEAKRLSIPRGADLVQIQIDLKPDSEKSYRAVVETADGRRVWSNGSLKARRYKSHNSIRFRLPASFFTKRDYILTLSAVNADAGLEGVGEYYFQVVKK